MGTDDGVLQKTTEELTARFRSLGEPVLAATEAGSCVFVPLDPSAEFPTDIAIRKNPMGVMLSGAKHLVFSVTGEEEILRLSPQDDIARQSPRLRQPT